MVNVSVADSAAQNIDKAASDSRLKIRFDIVPSLNSIVHCFLNILGHAQTRKILLHLFL
jgi:hypothetical protein